MKIYSKKEILMLIIINIVNNPQPLDEYLLFSTKNINKISQVSK